MVNAKKLIESLSPKMNRHTRPDLDNPAKDPKKKEDPKLKDNYNNLHDAHPDTHRHISPPELVIKRIESSYVPATKSNDVIGKYTTAETIENLKIREERIMAFIRGEK